MKQKLTRMERVLLNVISGLKITTVLGPYGHHRTTVWSSEPFEQTDQPGHFVHFAPWYKHGELKLEPGMIVFCETSGIHPFTISEVVEVLEYGRCLLRNLNDGSLCDMGNEAFTPIIGLDADALLTDEQVEFKRKVRKAFRQLDNYKHRYGGVDFAGDKATIWVYERYGGLGLKNRQSVPYAITMQWNKRTTIKSIRETMEEQGFGQREFGSKLNLKMIGSEHNVVSALIVMGDCDYEENIKSLLPYHVESGYRLNLITEFSQLKARELERLIHDVQAFQLDILTKNGERFMVDVAGVTAVSQKMIAGNLWIELKAETVEVRLVDTVELEVA